MDHELALDLRYALKDFETAAVSGSTHGNWSVSFGPIYPFGQRLQKALETIHAPSLDGYVVFEFLDSKGNRWAGSDEWKAKADDFWPLTWVDNKGEERPVMPERRAWIASRAWLKCRLECAQRLYPEIFIPPTHEEIEQNILMQRPSPSRRGIDRVHGDYGYPRVLKFSYATLLDLVQDEKPLDPAREPEHTMAADGG